MSGRLVLPALHHPPFPHCRTIGFLQRPTRSSQGRELLARLSKTLYGQDGPGLAQSAALLLSKFPIQGCLPSEFLGLIRHTVSLKSLLSADRRALLCATRELVRVGRMRQVIDGEEEAFGEAAEVGFMRQGIFL